MTFNSRALSIVCPECRARAGRLCIDVVPSGAHAIRAQIAYVAPRRRQNGKLARLGAKLQALVDKREDPA